MLTQYDNSFGALTVSRQIVDQIVDHAFESARGSLWLAILDDAAPAPPRLVPYDAAPTALEALADARIVSPDADRVRAILVQRMERPPEIFEALPTARDVAAFFAAHPEAAVRDPTPAYLHPAVDPHK